MIDSSYPYIIHTGREIELMLSCKKPMAAFCEVLEFSFDESIIPEQAFAPHVSDGSIVKTEVIIGSPPKQLRRVLFALPGEEWRMRAYLLMWEVAGKSGWNESLERMEGRLLGYADWQCDFHIQLRTQMQSS